MREDAACCAIGEEVLRLVLQLLGVALDEIVGMGLKPWMVEPHVVGHEIEHEPDPPLGQAPPQRGKCLRTAQSVRDRVVADCEARAGDVLVSQVRQRVGEFAQPLGVRARDFL